MTAAADKDRRRECARGLDREMTMTNEQMAAIDQARIASQTVSCVPVPLITGDDALHDWACQDHAEVESLNSHQTGWLAACRFYGFMKP